MKTLGIILSVLLVIVILLVAGLQIFLTKGLTAALNQGVFPAVEKMYGLEMSVTGASVNLFKGAAELDGFTVRNLKGYEEPYLLTFDKCVLDVEMLSLLKRAPIVIALAKAEGATLVIERNKNDLFNIKELAEALKPSESGEAPASQTPAEPQPATAPQPTPVAGAEAKPARPVPVHIRRIAIDARIKYTDSEENKTYDMNLTLTGNDFFTVPAEGQPNSRLVLRGSMDHSKNAFETDLSAILEPLTDLENPSFNATGSILDIDISLLGDLLEKNNMQSRSFSIKPAITCVKGQLQDSRIDVVFNDLTLYGTDIGDTTLKLPFHGTLENPTLDLTGALQSLLSEQSVKIGTAIGMRKLKKQLGVGTNAAPRDVLTGGLTNRVKEVSNSPALEQLIQQVASGVQSTNSLETNKPSGEVLVKQLDKTVKELEDNEELKKSLKNLGNSLRGK